MITETTKASKAKPRPTPRRMTVAGKAGQLRSLDLSGLPASGLAITRRDGESIAIHDRGQVIALVTTEIVNGNRVRVRIAARPEIDISREIV